MEILQGDDVFKMVWCLNWIGINLLFLTQSYCTVTLPDTIYQGPLDSAAILFMLLFLFSKPKDLPDSLSSSEQSRRN